MSEELKACPFCGDGFLTTARNPAGGGYVARCGNCSACGPVRVTREEALEAWNTRTPAPSDAARTESAPTCEWHDEGVGCRLPRDHEGDHAFGYADAAPTPPPMETAAVEEHCSNCGRPWTSGESADNKCCWEERKCALTRLRATTTARGADDDGHGEPCDNEDCQRCYHVGALRDQATARDAGKDGGA